jgi:AcrR family transcriptional regulator
LPLLSFDRHPTCKAFFVNVIPELDEPELPLSARGSQRRKDLIEAAHRVLVRDGHHAVTLRTVSVEADASHGSINYYFGSRSALMCAVADDVCRQIAADLAQAVPKLEECADNPDQFAAVMAHYSIKDMLDDRALGMAIQELTLAGARDEALRGVLVKWGKVDARLIRNAYLKLGSADPDLDYAFVLNCLGGLIMAQLAIPRRDFEARILRPSVLRLIRSIASEKLGTARAASRRSRS